MSTGDGLISATAQEENDEFCATVEPVTNTGILASTVKGAS